MSEEVAGAFIGFLGALIGAALTAWVALRQQKKDAEAERQRRADEEERYANERAAASEREREEQRTEARVFARLLLVDVDFASMRLKRSLKTDLYWSKRFAPPTESWLQYRERVAGYMDSADDWVAVSLFYRSLQIAELQAEAAWEKDPEKERPALTPARRRQIGKALERLPRAREALEGFAGETELDVEAITDEPDTA